jgi:hypothetical protein
MSGCTPLNWKLMIDATKRIKNEGTARTCGDDLRKQRMSAETDIRGAVRAARVEGDCGGGVCCAVAVVGALF